MKLFRSLIKEVVKAQLAQELKPLEERIALLEKQKLSNEEIIREIYNNPGRYLFKWGGRFRLRQTRIEADYQIGSTRSRRIRSIVEEKLGINKK